MESVKTDDVKTKELEKHFKRYFFGFKTKQTEEEVEYFKDVGKEIITIDDRNVAYYSIGEGEKTVLLVHGLFSRASKFLTLIKQLRSEGYRVVTFDVPGHGDSDGRSFDTILVSKIIAEINARNENIHGVVAHSFGCSCVFYSSAKEVLDTPRFVSISAIEDWEIMFHKYFENNRVDAELKGPLMDKLVEKYGHDENLLFSPIHSVKKYTGKLFLVHDDQDEVVRSGSANIKSNAENAEQVELLDTEKLGHFDIINDKVVISKVIDWFSN